MEQAFREFLVLPALISNLTVHKSVGLTIIIDYMRICLCEILAVDVLVQVTMFKF